MIRVIALRLIGAIPNLIGVVVVTFLLTRALPGDPAAFFAGAAATPEAVEQIREKLGLNKSLVEQFGLYLRDLAHGDFGQSLSTGQPVLTELVQRLPASLELTFFALLLATVIALPLGIMAATRPGSWIDHLCRLITTAGVSLPTFFTGLLLAYVFYFLLGIAPSPLGRLDPVFSPPKSLTGMYLIDSLLAGEGALFRACLAQLILPAVTMGIFVLAPLARMTRASMLGVLSSDFIRTARAKGLRPRTILFKHALRNAILPVVSIAMVQFGFLLGGSIVVESVFALNGIGLLAWNAIQRSDYPVVQAIVMIVAVVFVLLNFLADVLNVALDPRMRLG